MVGRRKGHRVYCTMLIQVGFHGVPMKLKFNNLCRKIELAVDEYVRNTERRKRLIDDAWFFLSKGLAGEFEAKVTFTCKICT